MVRDAEEHAAEDKRRRAEAETRNNADTLVYQTEKLLRDQGDKAPAEEKTKVEESLATLKTALEGSDVDAINRALETLKGATQAMGQKIYEAAAASASSASSDGSGGSGSSGSSSSSDGGGSDDEVVDAEIVDGPPTGDA
jgi:molecular chaperone DnaK